MYSDVIIDDLNVYLLMLDCESGGSDITYNPLISQSSYTSHITLVNARLIECTSHKPTLPVL